MITLKLKETTFYSPSDEANLFDWLKSIKAVKRVYGHGREIRVCIVNKPSQRSVDELMAVFRRYKGELKQISKIESSSVKSSC